MIVTLHLFVPLQLRIGVSDGGIPPCSKTAVATIEVQRNLQDPRFTQGEWPVEIMETHPLNEPVVTVQVF